LQEFDCFLAILQYPFRAEHGVFIGYLHFSGTTK
jgi:hypothetical protein